MKKYLAIVGLAVAIPVYASTTCTTVNVTDESGNVTGTDVVCTETVSKPITTTRSLKSINSRIKWLKQEIESVTAERTRDYDRATERINAATAEKKTLIEQRNIMKNAGANITEEDELACAVIPNTETNTTQTAAVDE